MYMLFTALGAAVGGLSVLAVAAALLILFQSKSPLVAQIARSTAANAVPLFYACTLALFLYLFETRVLVFSRDVLGSAQMAWIRVSYSFPFLSFGTLFLSDPGRITRKNWVASYARFPFDEILYLPGNECRTCHFAKPARSKHCSVCGYCVAMQDHHCVWVSNCIGLNNFRYFALFLLVNIYVFAYGWLILATVLWDSFRPAWNSANKWWQVVFRIAAEGERQRLAVCLLVLCTFLLPLVVVFAGFHLMYIWAGVTTNEADKWEDIRDLIPTRQLYYVPNTQIVLLKRRDGTFNRQLSDEEQLRALKIVETEAELPNLYDRGFLQNILVLLNPS